MSVLISEPLVILIVNVSFATMCMKLFFSSFQFLLLYLVPVLYLLIPVTILPTMLSSPIVSKMEPKLAKQIGAIQIKLGLYYIMNQ